MVVFGDCNIVFDFNIIIFFLVVFEFGVVNKIYLLEVDLDIVGIGVSWYNLVLCLSV